MPPAVIVPAIIASAVIGGGAAIASSAISAQGAKKAAKTQAEAQQAQLSAQQQAAEQERVEREKAAVAKEEAIKKSPYPTYLSIPESQKYKQTLEDRLAGRGLIDVSAITSPYAVQRRAGLEQTNRLISAVTSSEASSRGLGRSTIPISQIGVRTGEQSQAAEQDISERVQQLEIARQEQIGQAVKQYGTLSEIEAESQANKAKYESGAAFNIADTRTQAAAAFKGDQFSIANTIAAKGETEAAYQLRQAEIWAMGLQGLSQSALQTTEQLIGKIDNIQVKRQTTTPSAMVNRPSYRLTGAIPSRGIAGSNIPR